MWTNHSSQQLMYINMIQYCQQLFWVVSVMIFILQMRWLRWKELKWFPWRPRTSKLQRWISKLSWLNGGYFLNCCKFRLSVLTQLFHCLVKNNPLHVKDHIYQELNTDIIVVLFLGILFYYINAIVICLPLSFKNSSHEGKANPYLLITHLLIKVYFMYICIYRERPRIDTEGETMNVGTWLSSSVSH